MFGEDSVDDVGGSLLIAVDFVSVDVISRHGIAVTNDQLQHGGGKVFVRHADKCMSQFVNGGCNAVLCGVGVPAAVKVVWVGAVTIGVGEKPLGANASLFEHGFLFGKDCFRPLGEDDGSVCVYGLAGGYLTDSVNGPVYGQGSSVVVRDFQAAQFAGAQAQAHDQAESVDVMAGDRLHGSRDG